MSEIQFGQTHGEQLATLMRVVRDIHRDFYGNGSPGIKRRAEQFMDGHEAAQKEREHQHEQNSRKLNVLIAIATIILAIVGVATFFLAVGAKHGNLGNIKIFSSNNPQMEYSHERPTVANISTRP